MASECDGVKGRISRLNTRLTDMSLPDHTTPQTEIRRGLIRDVFADVWDCQPLHGFMPEEMGGSTEEILATVETVAYHHLPMALSMAINGVLFLLPVGQYAESRVRDEVMSRFSGSDVVLGGMMMTEPHCGTDLFAAKTAAKRGATSTRIRGEKHWSGLTGHADYWMVFARDEEAGRRDRFAFHVASADDPGFKVSEYYEACGLCPIPYGRTQVDIELPNDARIGKGAAYSSVVAGILQRSRLISGGVAHGFSRRVLTEARNYAESRTAFGEPLARLDQVAYRLERIQFTELIARAMLSYAANSVGTLHQPVPESRGCSRTIKALATDLMVDASDNLSMIQGAHGFRRTTMGLSALTDAHPFRIFEGPNDVLFDQGACDDLRRAKGQSLGEMLSGHQFTPCTSTLASLLDRGVEGLPQRDRVVLGRMIAMADAMCWMNEAVCFSDEELELAARHAEADMARMAVTLEMTTA
jgi:alkylation response protein AidB-like acyl-CoA dehydrogenase